MERGDIMGNAIALVVCGGESVVILSREVDDLKILGRQERRGLEQELVDSARALTAAGDEQRGARGIKLESLERLFARNRLAEILAHRRASDDTRGSGESFAAILKAEQDASGETRSETVRPPRDGVRLMDEAGQAGHPRSKNRSGRGEAAHAQDDGRAEAAIDRAALAVTLPKPAQEPQEGGGDDHRRHADRGKFLRAKFRMRQQCGGIDFLFGNKKQNLMTARSKRLGDGEPGEEVSTGSPASDDGFEGGHTRGSMCGRNRTDAKRETRGRPWRWILMRRPMRNRQTMRFDPP